MSAVGRFYQQYWTDLRILYYKNILLGSWNKSFAADWLEQNRTARLKPLYGGWEVSARKMGDIEVKIKGNAC